MLTEEENSGIGPLLEYEGSCGLKPLMAMAVVFTIGEPGLPGAPMKLAKIWNESESIAKELVLKTSQMSVTLDWVPSVTATTPPPVVPVTGDTMVASERTVPTLAGDTA